MIVPLFSGAARALYESLDWPNTEMEQWRRTDLRRLLPKGTLDKAASSRKITIEPNQTAGEILLPEHWAARVITEFGQPVAVKISAEAAGLGLEIDWASPENFPAELHSSGQAELDNSDDRIIAWHWADLPGALLLRLPANVELKSPVVIEERLALPSAEAGSLVSFPHLHIETGTGSKMAVLWSFEGAPILENATPIVNAGLSAVAGKNSKLDITVRQALGKKVVFFLNDYLGADSDTQLILRESHLGAALTKSRAHARLTGSGAYVSLKGVFLADEGQHADIGTLQEHRAPNTDSKAFYKGAVRPGGRSIFQGLIEVAPGASKTDAYLTNNNLVLGDGARADSLPKLNILTDDVRCSHGSTTGKLDADQLFYLVSRGFSPSEATRELTRGFLWEAVDGALPVISEILAADLDAALATD